MPANEQLLQRLLNVYGNDTQSIRQALSGLKGNVYEDGGKKKSLMNRFVQATLGAAMADNPSVMTASGWKYNSDGQLHQEPDENSDRLADNLAVISTLSPTNPATAATDAVLSLVGKAVALSKAAKQFKALKASTGSSSVMPGSLGTKAKELSQAQIDDILEEALGYKTSWQYDILNTKADTEATDNLILGYRKDAFTTYPENKPNIIFKELPDGIGGRYVKGENTIYLDPSRATDNTLYHEALHWLNVGDPTIEIGPNYNAWMSYRGGDKKKEAQLLKAFLKNEDELHRYNSLVPSKKYITTKVQDALYDGSNKYLFEPGELQVNGLSGGRAAGLKPFQEYPGRKVALEYFDKARDAAPALYDVAIDDPRGLERAWKILTGNYTPVIGAGILGASSAALAYPSDYTVYKSGGKIYIKPSHRGRFTSLLKRTGKPASWFKAHGTPAQKRMATFALNARHWKHEDGGPIQRAISSNKADVVLAAIHKMKSDVTP